MARFPGTMYNRVAGQNVGRLASLSDGIFSVAMTLLVLDLHVPASETVRSERDLWRGLVALAPQLVMYAMSFLTLGIFWIGQQTQMNYLTHSDRDLGWIHIAFLFAVSMVPFSTKLLAAFIIYRPALLVYWTNILALGLLLFVGWRYAVRNGLIKEDAPPGIGPAIERRILIAQVLYAVATSLCWVGTYASIAGIVLIQLYFAFAPRVRRRQTPSRDPG